MSARLPWRTRLDAPRAAVALSVVAAALAGASPARARAPEAPHWKLESRSAPTNLPLQGRGIIVAAASNVGDGEVNGEAQPVTLTDKLPPGLEATSVEGLNRGTPRGEKYGTFPCITEPGDLVVCTLAHGLAPYEQIEMLVRVKTSYAEASQPVNEVTVSGGVTDSGGEVPGATLSRPLQVNGEKTGFGIELLEITPENDEFLPDVEAGSHPFQLTATVNLNDTQEVDPLSIEPVPAAPDLEKNISFKLPPGLFGNANVVGNANAVQQCPGPSFGALEENFLDYCPENTALGVATVTFNDPVLLDYHTAVVPVFNLEPAPGEPARFGFEVAHVPIILDVSVRTGEDYGVTITVHRVSQAIQLLDTKVTLWGVPGDPRHDSARGWECLGKGSFGAGFKPPRACKPLQLPGKPAPFATLPTSCGEPLTTTVQGEAWDGAPLTGQRQYSSPALTGCSALPFEPALEVSPDQHAASTPTGMTVEVKLPQRSTLEPEGRAEAAVRAATLQLPEGVQTSAGAADGLETCGVASAGFIGRLSGLSGLPEHSQAELEAQTGGALESELETQGFTPAAASCPDAAKIGTASVKTPLLAGELEGSVYLAEQNTNPFASPLVLYAIVEEPTSKVRVKVAAAVALDQSTGRLSATIENAPQAPFESLTLHLFGGPRAVQAAPAACGGYQASGHFTSWAEGRGAQVSSNPEHFQITSGPGGGPCPAGALPFAPGFQAGSADAQAGAFTPFSATISRPDGQQALQALTIHLPTGLLAALASVAPCPEPHASLGRCGPENLIGHVTALSGLGPDPVTIGGDVYLTGPYRGAPFGLLSILHAEHVGPFNLGEISVRATITIDPYTAAVTIASDQIPRLIKGAPTQIKALNVTVDRAGFQFNPTNCNPLAITGVLSGYEGGSAAVSSPFRVGGCAGLAFHPKLTATVEGHGSKANGTGFTVKVESGPGQANVAKTSLQLPLALPSRLSTLQKACLAATFEANPAGCPEGSNVGFATARTPVLHKPLEGPAYLVSHGNAAFPDIEFVLQSEGITIVLDGKTDIKKGITYSRFESVPDAPIEALEAVLPAGPHSALTPSVPESERYSLCKTSLVMPTELVGQNGAVLRQNTSIVLTGCPRPPTRAQLLARALSTCRKKYKGTAKRRKRSSCEAQARKKYGLKSTTRSVDKPRR